MRNVVIIILTLGICSCGHHERNNQAFGDSVTTRFPLDKFKNSHNQYEKTGAYDLVTFEGKMIMISSSQFSPSESITIDNAKFDLVIDDGDTTYLETNDKHFKTPEGYRVGMKFIDVNDSLQKRVQKMPGWGYYIELSSKWSLGFCEGESCTDHLPRKSSRVKWIFKRK